MPDAIRNRIQIERLILCTKDEQLATEPEAMWYISTASLTAPLDHHWTNIFLYLTRKYMLSLGKRECDLPDFLRKQIILDLYMEEESLHSLRSWLFGKSFEHVKSRLKS
ncbi:hypothetical protein DESC_540008 [Desulfosarcina cetonica]|nr:hypothetical protein DESC_540008 [Desulfosarcina cetonica]